MKKIVNIMTQDSGIFEYYTDPKITEAAREVMGSINLDPASSEKANERVKAEEYFNEEENGIIQSWHGNVWMNHPFSRGEKICTEKCKKKTCKTRGYHNQVRQIPSNKDWVYKLINEYENGSVNQACCITYGNTAEKWFTPLTDYVMCLLSPRTNYFLPSGEKKRGVLRGSVVTYLGENKDKFNEVFSEFGSVMVKYRNGR